MGGGVRFLLGEREVLCLLEELDVALPRRLSCILKFGTRQEDSWLETCEQAGCAGVKYD